MSSFSSPRPSHISVSVSICCPLHLRVLLLPNCLALPLVALSCPSLGTQSVDVVQVSTKYVMARWGARYLCVKWDQPHHPAMAPIFRAPELGFVSFACVPVALYSLFYIHIRTKYQQLDDIHHPPDPLLFACPGLVLFCGGRRERCRVQFGTTTPPPKLNTCHWIRMGRPTVCIVFTAHTSLWRGFHCRAQHWV